MTTVKKLIIECMQFVVEQTQQQQNLISDKKKAHKTVQDANRIKK